MKVQLIVVQGKPEGKVIPLAVPLFRIGRGEDCQLRPNNEQVSRRHTEIVVEEDRVVVRDLGSRNGTFVNHKHLGAKDGDVVLKNGDLIQVGPLTFAVSIQGAPVAEETADGGRPKAKSTSLDEASNADIDSWLVSDMDKPAPERPSGVYSGDTQTFSAYKEAQAPKPEAQVPKPEAQAPKPEEPSQPSEDESVEEVEKIEKEEIFDTLDEELQDDDDGDEASTVMTEEELIDESNPFHVAKKKEEKPEPTTTKKPFDHDSSKAAEDVLRRMMERRRADR